MSSNISYSSASVAYSSSSNGQTTGQAYKSSTSTNEDGSTVRTTTQNLGERPVTETVRYDAQGNQIEGGNSSNANNRITETSEEADRLYLERMEDEYAKREGGA